METLIVVIIVGILLSMTMAIWSLYLRNVQYRYEKENFIGAMDKLITTVRTSNYRWNDTYTYIALELTTGSILAFVDTWMDAIEILTFSKSSLVISGGSTTIRLFPYNIACAEWANYEEENGIIYVDNPIMIPFRQIAAYTSQETCYVLDLRLCKLQQVSCTD